MKRTFERISFMLFGAILVVISYLAGNSDILQADDTKEEKLKKLDSVEFQDVIIQGQLIVREGIIVGNKSDPNNPSDALNAIFLKPAPEGPIITLTYNLTKSGGSDSAIELSAGELNGAPHAIISLRDKSGGSAVGTSNFGWMSQ